MHYASMRPRLVATCGPSLSLSSALLLIQSLSACIKMPRSAASFCSCPRRVVRRSYRCSTSTPPSSARTRAGETEELVYDKALGLVPEGGGIKLLVDGSTVLTGRIPWQMRRTAGPRPILQDVHIALAHMVG